MQGSVAPEAARNFNNQPELGARPDSDSRTRGLPSDADALLEDEGVEAEREFATFGGDAPPPLPRKPTTRQRNSDDLKTAKSRSKSTAATTPDFPELHLVDSAFSESHRVRSRAHSIRSNKARIIGAQGKSPGDRQQSTRREGSDEEDGGTSDPSTLVDDSSEPEESEAADPNKIDWAANDPENPQNWSKSYKWAITALASLLTVNVTFASSAPSSATQAIALEFGCSTETAVLVTSLFLCGYVLGPIIWAPLSELYGRRIIFLVTMFVYMALQMGDALGRNIQTILIIRFLAGTFAAAPLTNCGGLIADIWDPVGRGPAMSVFSASVFVGPVMGPIIGGFVTQSYLGWRWVFWVMGIFALTCFVLVAVFLPETYAPILLAHRARKLRKTDSKEHGEKWAELERADFSFKSILTRTLARPFKMLALEPILMLVTLYLSVIYGLLYALFSVFPIVWGQLRGFNNGETGLVFIGVGIGTTSGALINIYVQRHYKVLVPKWHGHPPPEERLTGAMLAGPFLLIGIFMLGWTGNYPSIPWYVPAIATIFLGMSFTLVFISFLSYLIECYLMYSASALAANTIVRSAVGAAFPLFTDQMFTRLGVNWACTLIGGIGILISPSPFIFYKYGSRIRQGSVFAPCLDIHMKERVEREEREESERAQRSDKVTTEKKIEV